MVWLIYVLFAVVHCAAFMVSVPSSHLVIVRGQVAVLGCEFSPAPDHGLSNLVVTWQRQEDSRVVHSFYYEQDQLDLQSVDYWNRTGLFVSELKRGNASLRMERVGPKDTGLYICVVSSMEGTDRAYVRLEYGAFYTEPRLSITVGTQGVMIQYEAEGFPKPEVEWVGADGQSLLHHTELTEGADEDTGLYILKSSYEAHSFPLTVTFILKNQLLNQSLQKPVNLSYGEEEMDSAAGGGVSTAVILLSLLCSLLVVGIMFLLMKRRCCIPS